MFHHSGGEIMPAMRRIFGLAILAAAGCLLVLPCGAQGEESRRVPDEKSGLIVHEWGTFTNFSGSSGVQLEFRPLLDSDLPPFVFDRALQSIDPMTFLLLKNAYAARQRMETPVTYFYTDRPRDVEVRVDFPKGLLTEFYPPVRTMGPAFDRKTPAKLENSFLDWGRIRLLPQADFDALQTIDSEGQVTGPALPKVEGDNHYAYARETDSAVVEFAGPWDRRYYEKFLFYRGLGSFSLPLTVQSLGRGRFEVSNSGPQPVRSLFLVHVEAGRIYFKYSPELGARGTLEMEQPSAASTLPQLGEAVVAALMETGLYEKEARSMVKTWQSSWFGEEGTRLFYLLPPSLTDEVLPLSISPPPDEVVRVLVGRMEVLTPEQAARISEALADLGTCATSNSQPLQGELVRLGRFAEPALQYLRQTTTDPRGQIQLAAILSELEQARQSRALK
jgi:hypothetical protein